ncbi:hypothetical protein XBJ2_440020 [Xenorhabdus bovienii str. Jollieti]|uniref:Uncharacterized protein n=1 Tax=Xenorhabdus bovienii (strain SS-2004) TaxID=406818 RepID=D3UX45_XENBS|nr:hypothetical protein XBJ1_0949 [Xenorhabdus bovienii SS-2004]CDH29803.1 hypothetical protein XBJ2_440020 [Xenorhabdus bovienii str. Jollieti]
MLKLILTTNPILYSLPFLPEKTWVKGNKNIDDDLITLSDENQIFLPVYSCYNHIKTLLLSFIFLP